MTSSQNKTSLTDSEIEASLFGKAEAQTWTDETNLTLELNRLKQQVSKNNMLKPLRAQLQALQEIKKEKHKK